MVYLIKVLYISLRNIISITFDYLTFIAFQFKTLLAFQNNLFHHGRRRIIYYAIKVFFIKTNN